jgi:hypothetical protein
MRPPATRKLIAALALQAAWASAAGAQQADTACLRPPIPAEAQAAGLTREAFALCPRQRDIGFAGEPTKALFNGVWYQRDPPAPALYADAPDGLALSLGGWLASASRQMNPGRLPLLSGSEPFFLEVEVSLSDNDRDHWPAVWMLPVEHNARQDDRLPGDPPKFERWLEIDIDEGGFGNGAKGTILAWEGVWPHYRNWQPPPILDNAALDRTRPNKFAVLYQPDKREFSFWLNDRRHTVVHDETTPNVMSRRHYYLILCAQSHGQQVPYSMIVESMRAYVQ